MEQLDVLASRSTRVLEVVADLFNANKEFNDALLYATGRGSSSNKRLEIMNTALAEVLNA